MDAQAGLYRSLLAGRRMVVVLDNAASPHQVRPLLPGSPTCVVVVTSRNQLSGLVARDGAHRLTLDVLPPEDAVTLLRCAVGHDRVDAEPEAAAEVARHCEYLPLALRIAAERAAARSHLKLADLAEELAVERDRLDVLTADDDEVTGVRAVFSWSYRMLAPEAARVFRLLGLHPGPDVGVASAAALTGSTTTAVRCQLAALTSAHLLTETRGDRYQFTTYCAATPPNAPHSTSQLTNAPTQRTGSLRGTCTRPTPRSTPCTHNTRRSRLTPSW